MEAVDVRDFGAPSDGKPQVSDRRLFFQLHVFEGCTEASRLVDPIEEKKCSLLDTVLYDDFNNPTGIGVLLITESPADLVTEARPLLAHLQRTAMLSYRPEMTMVGRTYSSGREPDLEEWLLERPRQNALNPDFPWAIWYPLRRKAEFYRLDRREQGQILGEHARFGRGYAISGYARDIRLACFGLDRHDNEFVIGLVGPDLHPLSRLIHDMRQTEQTARYIDSLGPFFVGKVQYRFRRGHLEKA